MSLKTTEFLEAKVKATVQRTGKTYYRSMKYAKHIIKGLVREPLEKAVHEYFLRKNRGWIKVSKEEFEEATSEEAVRKLHEKLADELKKRVQKEMRET